MFKIGDRVVYSSQGVGVIEAIEKMEVEGGKLRFYAIRLLKQTSRNLKLMVPVNNLEGIKLRYPIQEEAIPKVLDILNSPEKKELPLDSRECFPMIKRELESGEPHQLAELIRDLDGIKNLTEGEKSLLKRAWRQLIEELAYVQKLPRWQIEKEAEDLLETRRKACQGKKK